MCRQRKGENFSGSRRNWVRKDKLPFKEGESSWLQSLYNTDFLEVNLHFVHFYISLEKNTQDVVVDYPAPFLLPPYDLGAYPHHTTPRTQPAGVNRTPGRGQNTQLQHRRTAKHWYFDVPILSPLMLAQCGGYCGWSPGYVPGWVINKNYRSCKCHSIFLWGSACVLYILSCCLYNILNNLYNIYIYILI